jgi:hypothetical protein
MEKESRVFHSQERGRKAIGRTGGGRGGEEEEEFAFLNLL